MYKAFALMIETNMDMVKTWFNAVKNDTKNFAINLTLADPIFNLFQSNDNTKLDRINDILAYDQYLEAVYKWKWSLFWDNGNTDNVPYGYYPKKNANPKSAYTRSRTNDIITTILQSSYT